MAAYAASARNQPKADIEFDWIWKAWHRLSDDRPRYGGGMGPAAPGRVPWMTVKAWAVHYQLSPAEMALLDTCFTALDTVYIEHWIASQQKDE